MPIPITGLFTPSGGADAFDLVSWHDVASHNWAATVAPGTGDDSADGYVVGSLWCDTTHDKAYVCLDNSVGAAVWTEITVTTGGSGSVGLMGPPGMDGLDGADGWPIPGLKGDTGSAGGAGAAGAPGIGMPGVDGADGLDSMVPGPAGATGSAGATGAVGPMGMPGVDGADGQDGFPIPGPAGAAGAGGGAMATDPLWDAKGDLAGGTGANTAAKLTVGANDTMLMAASGETTGLKWANKATILAAIDREDADINTLIQAQKIDDLTAGDDNTDLNASNTAHGLLVKATVPGAANLLNVVGIATGETAYTNKVLFDGTAPEAIGVAAAGTGVVAAHRNHVHSNYVILSWLFSGTCSVKTHEAKFRLPFALTYSDIKLHVLDGNEPSGASLIVDIQTSTDDAAWTTIWTTKPEIDAAAQEEDNNQATSDTAYAANDYFKCMITQIGSTNPGVGLMVNLILTR